MSAEQGKKPGETPRYSRSLRKAFAALETASLGIQDPNNISSSEQAKLDRARTRLEARGIPQNVIEQHTIPTFTEPIPALDTVDIADQPEPVTLRVFAPLSALRNQLDPHSQQVHDTALMDALLSGSTIVFNFDEGYTPKSSQLRPVPPRDPLE